MSTEAPAAPPIAPAAHSPRRSLRTSHPPPSPSTPREKRARKPSAKVLENAAGPSHTAPADSPEPPAPPTYLQPHHFSPLNNGAKPPVSLRTRWEVVRQETQDLSPEDDPMALRGIPVFHPTMEEFKDFEAYVTRTVPWGMRSGIVKVVPPAEWTAELPALNRQTLAKVEIRSPIQQHMMGKSGVFRASNIEKNKARALSVHEWFEKCQQDAFASPPPKTYDRDSKEAKQAHEEAMREKKEREVKRKEEWRRKREKKDKVQEPQVDEWYEETDLKTAWLPRDTQPEDYTDEACARLQDRYWKTMGMGEPSWYGADLMQGSLFVDRKTPWNVAHLPNLLDRIGCVVPGVNEPYLYFGMWRATFAWHVEDMDLFSINYIHFGAPKYWYAIPQAQAEQLERFLKNEFPIDSQQCDQFIRHKSLAISPSRLREAGIRCNMLVHRQNEYVITYPKGYHAGFNLGFNCAESVNFALDNWVEYGRKAKHCQCVSHSVRINVDKMLAQAEDAVHQQQGAKVLKRKRDVKVEVEEVPAYRPSAATETIHLPAAEPPAPRAKRPYKRRVPSVNGVFPCLFCPSQETSDRMLVHEPSEATLARWKGEGPVMVHIRCAQATPEITMDDIVVDGRTETVVQSVDNISKDRWKLKCKYCSDKVLAQGGVKVQCTKGKCPQAYHFSCAQADERVKCNLWQVEQFVGEELETFLKLELLCPTHNPEWKEQKAREKLQEVSRVLESMLPGQAVQIKVGSATVDHKFVGVLADQMVEVELDGVKQIVPWARVVVAAPPLKVEDEYARHHTHKREKTAKVEETKAVPKVHPPPETRPVVHPPPFTATPLPLAKKDASRVPSHASHQPYGPPYPAHPSHAYPPPHPHNHAPPYLPPPSHAMPPVPMSLPPPPVHRQVIHPYPQPPIPNRVYCVDAQGYAPPYPHYAPPAPRGVSHLLNPAPPAPVGIDLGLLRMRRLMDALPRIRTPTIHLAGTNGKGSVSAMLESCLLVAGLRTGRYNSPHLLEPRDAIRLNGAPAPADAYERAMYHVQQSAAAHGIEPTPFEAATAAAFCVIGEYGADVMIIECGMGGARDATNVIPEEWLLASALTSVGLDHTAFLGDTIEAITEDKAQIASKTVLYAIARQTFPAADRVAREVAERKGAAVVDAARWRVTDAGTAATFNPIVPPSGPTVALTLPAGKYNPQTEIHVRLPLAGKHQIENLALAVSLLHAMRHDPRAGVIQGKLARISDRAIQIGIEQTRWDGRCSWLRVGHDLVLVDGAHNADSARTLRHYIDSLGAPRISFVVGLSDSKGKTSESVLAPLLRPGDGVAAVRFSEVEGMPWVRCVEPREVERAAWAVVGSGGVDIMPSWRGDKSLQEAVYWAQARGGLVVVCGSLYLVADVYRAMDRGLL